MRDWSLSRCVRKRDGARGEILVREITEHQVHEYQDIIIPGEDEVIEDILQTIWPEVGDIGERLKTSGAVFRSQ